MKKPAGLSVGELNRIKRVATIAGLSWMIGAPVLLLVLGNRRFTGIVITIWWGGAAFAILLYVCLFFHRLFFKKKD